MTTSIKKKHLKIVSKSERKTVLFKTVMRIWGKDFDFISKVRRGVRIRKNFYYECRKYINGIVLVLLILLKCVSIPDAKQQTRVDVLKKFFDVKNFCSIYVFLKERTPLMSFFNAIKSFDKHYHAFFNFFLLYNPLALVKQFIYQKNIVRLLDGFFIPVKRFFSCVEMFKKDVHLNLFNFDFFDFLDFSSPRYNYIVPYDQVLLRVDVKNFFLLFKYLESTRMAKYNEYIINSYYFTKYVEKRVDYIQRYYDNISMNIGRSLFSVFFIALTRSRYLFFTYSVVGNKTIPLVTKGAWKILVRNNHLNFFLNVSKKQDFNDWLVRLYPNCLDMYLHLDIFKAVMFLLKRSYAFKWKTTFHYLDIVRLVKTFYPDMALVSDFIVKKMCNYFVVNVINDKNLINYYFSEDLICNFFIRRFYFFNYIFNVIFWDFCNERILLERAFTFEAEYFIDYDMATYFLREGAVLFNCYPFENDIIDDYLEWFYSFEYFYWRLFHLDHSMSFEHMCYIRNAMFDHFVNNRVYGIRYVVETTILRKCLALKSKGDIRSFFFIYYLYLFYRDVMVKCIYSSFELKLLFFFLFCKDHYFDKLRVPYILKANSDMKCLKAWGKKNN